MERPKYRVVKDYMYTPYTPKSEEMTDAQRIEKVQAEIAALIGQKAQTEQRIEEVQAEIEPLREQEVAKFAQHMASTAVKDALGVLGGGTRKNKKRSRRHKKRRGKKTRRHSSKRYKR